MAKRRKLEAPDPVGLADFEDRFRRETEGPPPAALIRAMAADSAAAGDFRDEEALIAAGRIRAEAAAFTTAKELGLVLKQIPLDEIDDTILARDRSVIDEDELLELRGSSAQRGSHAHRAVRDGK